MRTKDEEARELARKHYEIETGLTQVFRRLLTEESVKPGAGLDALETALEVARRVEERPAKLAA